MNDERGEIHVTEAEPDQLCVAAVAALGLSFDCYAADTLLVQVCQNDSEIQGTGNSLLFVNIILCLIFGYNC